MTDDNNTAEPETTTAPAAEPVAPPPAETGVAPVESVAAAPEVPTEAPTVAPSESVSEPVAEAAQPTEVPTTPEVETTGAESPTSEPPSAAPASAAESVPTPATETEPPQPKKHRKPKEPKAAPAAVATEEPASETAPGGSDAPATDEAPAELAPEAGEVAPAEPEKPENKKRWYAVKIQSGREESIKAAIERKVKIEGLEQYFGQIVIPVEELIVKKKVRVKNKKTGETTTQEKNVTKYNKKFPGYLFTEVEFNNEILYVFRETSGVGDFVGVNTKKTQGAVERSPPAPMTDAEVTSMLTGVPDPNKKRGPKGKVVVKLDVEKGDKVRIKNGAFANSEGEVKSITEPKDPADTPKITVVVTFWGRPVDVEVDYWEVDKV